MASEEQRMATAMFPRNARHYSHELLRDVDAWVFDRSKPVPVGYVEEAFARLIAVTERSECNREGLRDTPHRAARAWAERMAGYSVDPADLFTTFDADGYDEMVVLRDIPFDSTCEHHLERITGKAHIAYIAEGRIVGLSKLARLVDAFAKRLQVQERMTAQIADAIAVHLKPKGVAVVLEASHGCIECRGVQKPGIAAITSVLRGAMMDDPIARAEAFTLLRP